ncbi:unnamed protein product [Dovyalis caffra]|uniref:Uncharacterized protein n=1 Tax=Dovyalis caffra TaxID=77055 RepID=A0AAV1SI69_9ROSI|nr:unnamed protein product [Dovyalis caffra]
MEILEIRRDLGRHRDKNGNWSELQNEKKKTMVIHVWSLVTVRSRVDEDGTDA